MKCDELKQVEYPIEWGLYYDKSEVDAAIAELKAKLEDVQASMYCDLVDANMEIRRLKDKSLDVKNVAHVLKAFKFYLCQLTHCTYDERTAQWIIDHWEQDYKRIEADK